MGLPTSHRSRRPRQKSRPRHGRLHLDRSGERVLEIAGVTHQDHPAAVAALECSHDKPAGAVGLQVQIRKKPRPGRRKYAIECHVGTGMITNDTGEGAMQWTSLFDLTWMRFELDSSKAGST